MNNKPVVVYVPQDSFALACGAESVLQAISHEAKQRNIPIEIKRNGSHGMAWLEPLVEVQTDQGRFAYGPVSAADVPSLFDAHFWAAGPHPLARGLTSQISFLARQKRLTFARVGVIEPCAFADYERYGGLKGLRRALAMQPKDIVALVTDSGLRGRGGAAFPAGVKWRTVLNESGPQKYIVCNADEGDSGTFADRMLIEGDPFSLIEGMVIAGLAVGSRQGYVYLRSEYPQAIRVFEQALFVARKHGLLGPRVLDSEHAFEIVLRVGAGSYVCGEETAMLESIEGKRGVVRAKPPLPAAQGLFGCPTVVNNVMTLATVPVILEKGADFYAAFGTGRSRGTLPIQLAGNIRYGGLIEAAFGLTLRELLHDYGGGAASGRPIRAVQVGGPLGGYLPESQFDVTLDYETFIALGGTLGHGGVVVFDDSVDLARQARWAMEFCAIESCGKCTPCRVGSTRGHELLARVEKKGATPEDLVLLEELCEVMAAGSLCAMGSMTPVPVRSALQYFPEDFSRRLS